MYYQTFISDFQEMYRKLKEQMKYARFPGNCNDLKMQGLEVSNKYLIDFDGIYGPENPVEAFCNFEDHSISMGKTISKQCHSRICSPLHLAYDSLNQVKNMIRKADGHCQQNITIQCGKGRDDPRGGAYVNVSD